MQVIRTDHYTLIFRKPWVYEQVILLSFGTEHGERHDEEAVLGVIDLVFNDRMIVRFAIHKARSLQNTLCGLNVTEWESKRKINEPLLGKNRPETLEEAQNKMKKLLAKSHKKLRKRIEELKAEYIRKNFVPADW